MPPSATATSLPSLSIWSTGLIERAPVEDAPLDAPALPDAALPEAAEEAPLAAGAADELDELSLFLEPHAASVRVAMATRTRAGRIERRCTGHLRGFCDRVFAYRSCRRRRTRPGTYPTDGVHRHLPGPVTKTRRAGHTLSDSVPCSLSHAGLTCNDDGSTTERHSASITRAVDPLPKRTFARKSSGETEGLRAIDVLVNMVTGQSGQLLTWTPYRNRYRTAAGISSWPPDPREPLLPLPAWRSGRSIAVRWIQRNASGSVIF